MSRAWATAVLLATLVASDAHAQAGEAETALAKGQYARAETLLEEDPSPDAAVLRGRLLLATGRYDEAAELLDSLASSVPDLGVEAPLWAARAHLRRGRTKRARELLQPLVKRRVPEALDIEAQAADADGDHADALRARRTLIELYNEGAVHGDDGRGLMAVARAAFGLGAVKDANSAFAEATRASPHDVSIQLAWAELFLSKYAGAEAAGCLKRALLINPSDARALERLARVDFELRLDFVGAQKRLEQALAVDPALTAAHVTLAAMALKDHELERAQAHLERALETNPRDLEALSVAAAIRFVAHDRAGFRAAEQAVLSIDPQFSRMYSVIAGYAEWEHRYDELVKLADAALRIQADDAYAHATRGLNLLRVGREREGLTSLHAAWQLDHYNERVFNTLNLYEEVIAPHYVSFASGRYRLRTHRDDRVALQPYLAPLLERGYASMRARYGIAPKGPLYFELYADAEHFSVRTTGLPRMGVQGVCFGKVVTALSPAAGPINWGQILWHEQAHVFHIALSDNRVPRWFTEGLAEYETEIARPEWRREDDESLLDALERQHMPSIGRLNHAFTHARSTSEVMVAYYASSRVVAFLVERFGFEIAPKLLGLWGKGLTTEEVFAQGIGMTIAQLDAAFRSYSLERMASLRAEFRVHLEDYESVPYWRRQVGREPSPPKRAGLAMALLLHADLKAAESTAQEALKGQADQPLALWVIAESAFREGREDETQRALSAMFAAGVDGYAPRLLAARAALKAQRMEDARKQLERAVALRPDGEEAYVALGVLADQTGDAALRAESSLARARIDQHEPNAVRMALPFLADAQRWADVAALAESGVYVMPQSSLLHRFWARALSELGQPKQALEVAQRAVTLATSPEEEATALLERARARAGLGQARGARTDAEAAVEQLPALREKAAPMLSR